MEFLADLWGDLMPAILTLIGLVLTFLINRASAAFTLWSGIQVEEKHRLALHSALMSGAEAALSEEKEINLDQVIRASLDYAHQSVPDALKALNPSGGVLNRLATRYARKALEGVRS